MRLWRGSDARLVTSRGRASAASRSPCAATSRGSRSAARARRRRGRRCSRSTGRRARRGGRRATCGPRRSSSRPRSPSRRRCGASAWLLTLRNFGFAGPGRQRPVGRPRRRAGSEQRDEDDGTGDGASHRRSRHRKSARRRMASPMSPRTLRRPVRNASCGSRLPATTFSQFSADATTTSVGSACGPDGDLARSVGDRDVPRTAAVTAQLELDDRGHTNGRGRVEAPGQRGEELGSSHARTVAAGARAAPRLPRKRLCTRIDRLPFGRPIARRVACNCTAGRTPGALAT